MPTAPPHVTVHPATGADQPALRRLMQFYLYDFSEFADVPFDGNAFFGQREFVEEQFGPAHDTFVIRADDDLVGFAIITRGSYLAHDPATTDMTQFFIVRGSRQHGVGASAATQLFTRYSGPWEVRVVEANTVARSFWRRTINLYTQGNFAESHLASPRHNGPLFTFTTPTQGK